MIDRWGGKGSELVFGEKEKKDKKTRIVEAAARVFAQKGFFGTVVADIAVEAGVGKGTIYEYFKSKEDLFFAVFEWLVNATGTEATVSVAAMQGSAAERLKAFGEALLKAWDDKGDLYTLVMEFWAASGSSQMRERFKLAFREGYREYRAAIAALIEEGVASGEFRPDLDAAAIAAALVGAADALLLQAWFDPSFDPLGTAKEFMEVVLRGLSRPAQGGE
jgi:AcrR family transcriptional regulator